MCKGQRKRLARLLGTALGPMNCRAILVNHLTALIAQRRHTGRERKGPGARRAQPLRGALWGLTPACKTCQVREVEHRTTRHGLKGRLWSAAG